MRTRVSKPWADSRNRASEAARCLRRALRAAVAADWKPENLARLRSLIKRADGALRHRTR